jgi:pSer/pThr/pTyr-binding forkhead associated (FHA) protein
MELKLIVLAGAKDGTQIPLKKDKFVIGRASECTLRAGSDAISRRHCSIVRTDGIWIASDMGSRNGTYINDQKIEAPTALAVGDILRVGPLKFRVEEYVKRGSDVKVAKPAAPVAAANGAANVDQPQDINRAKQPPVKSVSEVIERTVSKGDGSATEDDVSRWLLGLSDPTSADAMRETTTLSMEDTTTIARVSVPKHSPAPARQDAADEETDEEEVDIEEVEKPAAQAAQASESSDSGSGGWGFFKKAKGGKKSAPGKLPPRPAESTKDSREAAADILREMTRRR